ncbi:deoxynucleoside kinase [Persicimonas caeni]|jgi:deoxyadenosine/deoxycytidine kinase|uniref:Deoxynucleoside kinase n=1 Tax=Persicimonas caeni TaxID=2292766 RepID=A0A4Y6PUN6_PERCE|nr:deoxynucleoside kinase [Persicimonas caeni]QDG51465.1 deoxynucleoside kinase [Persicimonas caeni]QED32686.1 deoxynucleoside kinase [Persicimonas caeni]
MPDLTHEFPRYIVIEGPIGVGKTTLVNLLAERYRANTVLEIFEENPFLAKFYGDRDAYAFQTEMFFLLSRYKQQEQFSQRDLFSTLSVSDYLFVKCRLFASLTLSDHELSLYDRMYNILTEQVPTPDVVVHLHAPLEILHERINKRGRSYEQDMDLEYLDRLRGLYHNFFAHYEDTPLVEVDTADVHFAEEPDAVEELMDRIQRAYQASKAPPKAIEF